MYTHVNIFYDYIIYFKKQKGGIKMHKETYQLEKLTSSTNVEEIEGMLRNVRGVDSSEVALRSSTVTVYFNENAISSEEIKEKIVELGFEVLG